MRVASISVMAAARREYRGQLPAARTGVGVATGPAGAAAGGVALQRPREPKAVVFSEFINDLEQVTSLLVQSVGQEAVAQHWGVFRSTELAAFRNGKTTYRQCPRCGFHNDVHVKADCCDRRLIEVLLQPHDALEPPPGAPSAFVDSYSSACHWTISSRERGWCCLASLPALCPPLTPKKMPSALAMTTRAWSTLCSC